ncbi:MAG TPA: class I SAM-dependent methyltransferase [Lentisphaeria bacterium]|nr:class I SAM-dependent methyltransferase [Lentisphaerota bacterium]HQC53353.1 class I SAM-dependent methyltransferase [Lentisphaeria bacterium]HQL87273.1 class I SAM-dependent methyltransferase [Lentisphaeria bacterium]
MNQLDYWNSIATTKAFTTDFKLEIFRARVPKDAQVLDVGCGYGRIMAKLWAEGYRHLTGLDPAHNLIRRGQSLFPHLRLLHQNNPDVLDVPGSSVDAVLLCGVLTCVVQDDAQQRLVNEIYRVLKPGGNVYCSDFLLNDDERNLERYQRFAARHGTFGVFELPEGALLRHHAEPHIHRLFAAFLPDCYETVVFPTMNGHTSRGFYLMAFKPGPGTGAKAKTDPAG